MHSVDMGREIQAYVQGWFMVGSTLIQIDRVSEHDPGYPMLRDADWFPGLPDVVENFSERASKFHVRDGFFHEPLRAFALNMVSIYKKKIVKVKINKTYLFEKNKKFPEVE
jgi:hypothetical protein